MNSRPYMKSRLSHQHVWHVVVPDALSGYYALCNGHRLPVGPSTSVHYPHEGRYCQHCLRALREEALWRKGLADNWSAFDGPAVAPPTPATRGEGE